MDVFFPCMHPYRKRIVNGATQPNGTTRAEREGWVGDLLGHAAGQSALHKYTVLAVWCHPRNNKPWASARRPLSMLGRLTAWVLKNMNKNRSKVGAPCCPERASLQNKLDVCNPLATNSSWKFEAFSHQRARIPGCLRGGFAISTSSAQPQPLSLSCDKRLNCNLTSVLFPSPCFCDMLYRVHRLL